jgi:hypothetical protein
MTAFSSCYCQEDEIIIGADLPLLKAHRLSSSEFPHHLCTFLFSFEILLFFCRDRLSWVAYLFLFAGFE